jgi:hypothetical protein
MKKLPLALISAAAFTLLLTGCGSSSGNTATATPTATEAAVANGAFGSPLAIGGGVTVTVSAPVAFKPGQFASNFFAGQVPNKFDVKVTNGSAAAFDLSGISITAASGTNTCVDILDGDNGINGAPTDPVATKGTATFTSAIGCAAKVGDPLTLTLAFGSTTATITGSLK